MFKNPTIDFNALFNSLGNSTCSSPEVVLAFLLYEGSTIHNASDQFVSCVYFFFCRLRSSPILKDKNQKEYAPTSNSCIFTPIENWTHVYMNLFTRNSPYYHLLKYLLFLLKHPVYIYIYIKIKCFLFVFVCFISIFFCTLYKSTFLNRSQPNFANVSPFVWRRS